MMCFYNFPHSPSFSKILFSPAFKVALGGAKMFGVHNQKICIFKTFFQILLCYFPHFSSPTTEVWGGREQEDKENIIELDVVIVWM